MKLVYSPKYEVNLGEHVFVTKKFRLIKEKLISLGVANEEDFVQPTSATEEDVTLVHTQKYYTKVINLKLNLQEIIKLEIPLTKEIVEASLICCGGTILASNISLESGVGIHIGGGFHHAYPDHGEGFCVFNDIAIAIKKLKKEKKIKRALIVDCDLHQGNGTAFIFKNDKDVFTFSMHEEDIYPYPKEKSDYDIGLQPYTTDDEYLSLLDKALSKIAKIFSTEIIIYQAGADPFCEDQLGSLKLTKEGLKNRDKLVYEYSKRLNVPITLTLGGGYAKNISDTVDIHTNTILVFMNKI